MLTRGIFYNRCETIFYRFWIFKHIDQVLSEFVAREDIQKEVDSMVGKIYFRTNNTLHKCLVWPQNPQESYTIDNNKLGLLKLKMQKLPIITLQKFASQKSVSEFEMFFFLFCLF